jgi:hypothetical protein
MSQVCADLAVGQDSIAITDSLEVTKAVIVQVYDTTFHINMRVIHDVVHE